MRVLRERTRPGDESAAVMPAFGPEWNPVLVLLAVLAVLCILAAFKWWLGLIGICVALVVLAVEA